MTTDPAPRPVSLAAVPCSSHEYHPRKPRLFRLFPSITVAARPDDDLLRRLVNRALEGLTRQLQIGYQFGQAMLQRPALAQFTQGDLRGALQGAADMPG